MGYCRNRENVQCANEAKIETEQKYAETQKLSGHICFATCSHGHQVEIAPDMAKMSSYVNGCHRMSYVIVKVSGRQGIM